MREPVIEDNAADHAQFCKYAADLLERVTGKSLATSAAVPSLSRITKVTWSQLPLYLFKLLWRRWFVIHSGSPDQNEKKLKLWCALVYKRKPKSQRNNPGNSNSEGKRKTAEVIWVNFTEIRQLHDDDIWLQLTEFISVLLCYLNLSIPLRMKEQ